MKTIKTDSFSKIAQPSEQIKTQLEQARMQQQALDEQIKKLEVAAAQSQNLEEQQKNILDDASVSGGQQPGNNDSNLAFEDISGSFMEQK